ncbi:MAG TPA: hypothetical protein VGC13_30700 [Longimicrobium sp.]|uniref:hypothetical protein n=1 Tax=Longimicrobium sp. TaxID=2029185 RepID=UPI002EDB8D1F
MTQPAVPEVPARLVFAGGEWTEAHARVIERTPGWRRSSALTQLGLWLLAPVVFWIPPHVPWVLLVLGLGAVRALNRFREHRTLVSLRGACPKCGTGQEFGETGRMKQPHTVHCASCRWELRVDVPLSGAVT